MINKKLTAIAAAFFLASCSLSIGGSSTDQGSASSSQNTSEAAQELQLDEEYGRQTSLAISLLTDSITQQGPLARRRAMTEEEELAAIAKVERYLGIMEQLLSDSPVETVVTESDREGFAFKAVVTTTMLDGTSSEFTMYFNAVLPEGETSSETSSEEQVSSEEVTSSEASSEEVVSSEVALSEEPSSESTSSEETSQPSARKMSNDEDEDEEDEEDEEEREEIDDEYDSEDREEIDEEDGDEYEEHHSSRLGDSDDEGEVTTLSGIAIIGDVEYSLVGATKVEDGETKTSYFLSLDESNWIKVSTKVEDGETSYTVLKKTGGLVSRISIETELEDDGVKVKMFIQPEAGQPTMYKFFRAVDEVTGDQYVRIEARDGDGKFKVRVLITTDELGNAVYKFRFDGSEREYDEERDHDYRDSHDDDHDEEDED